MVTVSFEHNDQEYEIRVIPEGDVVNVKAFLNGVCANRFTYSATFEVLQDMATVKDLPSIQHLIMIAKQDIIDGL